MKILFIEPCPMYFGGYFRALNIARGLSDNNCQTDILITSNKKFLLKIIKHKIDKNINLYELPRFFLNNYIQGRLLRSLINILFAIFKQYDIYHIAMPVEPESNIPALFLKLIGKKNLVIDWDEIYYNGILKSNRILNFYNGIFEYIFPKLFNNYCVVSEILKQLSIKRGAKNIIKIINAVNTNQFPLFNKNRSIKELKLNKKYLNLFIFGNTLTGNRVSWLFKTAENLLKINPNINFYTTFDPIQILSREKYENMFSEFTIKKFIKTGYLSEDMLGKYLSGCDATLFLMDNSFHDRACFPTRVGTALAGNSIIATNDNNSEASNLLKKHDCAIVAPTIEDLPNLIISTLSSNNLKIKLLKNILLTKQKLSYKNQTRILKKYYQKIILSNSSR